LYLSCNAFKSDIQYFQSDLKALQDKYKGEAVEFIQADLTQNIDLENKRSTIAVPIVPDPPSTNALIKL
jgi:hypothetical protein